MVLIAFFLFFSDIFITLRCVVPSPVPLNQPMRFRPRLYAITLKNNTLVVYFGILAFARLTTFLVSFFVDPTFVVDLPEVPVDAFNMCAINMNPELTLAPISIGTTFGTWLDSFQLNIKDR